MAESLSNDQKLFQRATKYQQNCYELSSDWNIYNKVNQLTHLKNYIGYALYGTPEVDNNFNPYKQYKLYTNSKLDFYVTEEYNYAAEKKEVINMIFTQMLEIEENKYTSHVQCAVIYIVIYGEELEKPEESKEKRVFPIPIFKVARSMGIKEQQKVYIDNNGRVYQNWTDYITNNTLPKCTMVCPKDGYYQADPSAQGSNEDFTTVWLECCDSPACNVSAAAQAMDVATTVMGVVAMGVGVASMLTPITAPLGFLSAAGGVSSIWSFGRCTQQLADRSEHKQSINITSKPALGAWLGIAGSTVGMAGSGSQMLLSKAIRNGVSVGLVARSTYNAIAIGNIVINGIGISVQTYNIYENYQMSGEVSIKDVAFLTAHIFFFSNSVLNFSSANDLIKSTQGKIIEDFEKGLRTKRHHKEYKKLKTDAGAGTSSEIARNEEIIRKINQIDSKDDYFNAIVQSRKAANKAKLAEAKLAEAKLAEVKVPSEGKVTINDATPTDPMKSAKLPAEAKTPKVKVPSEGKVTINDATPTDPMKSTKLPAEAKTPKVKVPSEGKVTINDATPTDPMKSAKLPAEAKTPKVKVPSEGKVTINDATPTDPMKSTKLPAEVKTPKVKVLSEGKVTINDATPTDPMKSAKLPTEAKIPKVKVPSEGKVTINDATPTDPMKSTKLPAEAKTPKVKVPSEGKVTINDTTPTDPMKSTKLPAEAKTPKVKVPSEGKVTINDATPTDPMKSTKLPAEVKTPKVKVPSEGKVTINDATPTDPMKSAKLPTEAKIPKVKVPSEGKVTINDATPTDPMKSTKLPAEAKTPKVKVPSEGKVTINDATPTDPMKSAKLPAEAKIPNVKVPSEGKVTINDATPINLIKSAKLPLEVEIPNVKVPSEGKVTIVNETLIDPMKFAQFLSEESKISIITASSLLRSQETDITVTAPNQKSETQNLMPGTMVKDIFNPFHSSAAAAVAALEFALEWRDSGVPIGRRSGSALVQRVKQNDSPITSITINLGNLDMHPVELMHEIKNIDIDNNILRKLMTLAVEIEQRHFRDYMEDYIFLELVAFLWVYVKMCLKEINPDLPAVDKIYEEIYVVVEMVERNMKVEKNMELFYDAFCIAQESVM